MASLANQEYIKLCAKIAGSLSISISSARKKVELLAAKKSSQKSIDRIAAAKIILKELDLESDPNNQSVVILDNLMKALEEEENFMTED
tara:strand:+ start:5220 stop:5486 length:267 start_codon:yes stop_codon:yes gene_type:complete